MDMDEIKGVVSSEEVQSEEGDAQIDDEVSNVSVN
jgi:hypothetical protein